jgi:hypothetical protein
MRHIRLATSHSGISRILSILCAMVSALALTAPSAWDQTATKLKFPVLDLTASPQPEEQGLLAIPGAAPGGITGQTTTRDRYHFKLPIELEILDISPGEGENFAVTVLLRNVGANAFDLPSSRNITKIEKPGNTLQRVFFIRVEPVPIPELARGENPIREVGAAATGGSTSVSGSFMRMDPGSAIQVILPVTGALLKHALERAKGKIEVRVVCNEWQLDDNRYFLNASSEEAVSKNVFGFVLRGNVPVPSRP